MSECVLYIWPAKWNLESLDPTCLATVMYLQLTIPGKFKVAPCSNPDQSPNGQLPFLTHAHTTVSSFPSIVAFVSSLAKSSNASGVTDLDASLTSLQRAEKVALYAHVEAYISDLVSHLFYGTDANFWGLTNPALTSGMPIPQKYYVGRRIRDAYRPRLEAAGLWSSSSPEDEQPSLFEKDKKKRDYKVTLARAFEREKTLDKAKTALGVHANYLDGKQFFFGDRPTSLDVYLAAHILLVADPPFPDAVLQVQLLESYPGLVEHARRIQAEVAKGPSYDHFTPSGSFLGSLVPHPFGRRDARTQDDPADIQYNRKSLLFVVAAAAMAVAYCYTYFTISLSIGDSKDGVGDGEEEESGEEEGEGELADESGVFTDDSEE